MTKKMRFLDKNKSGFYATLRKRVDDYFIENKISKHANAAMYIKTIILMTVLVGSYALIISGLLNIWVMFGLALLIGATSALIGFNVGHDAIHGSYTSSPKANKILSHSFTILGANPYMWNIMHNIVHHTYTNIPGHDEDIEVAPGIVRLSPTEKLTGIQRYQHYYAFFLYSLASLSWVFKKDFVKFFQKIIGSYDNSKHPVSQYIYLFAYKIFYAAVFIVVPLMVLDITWWQFLIGFIALHMVEGLVLGLVFQLAHVVEGTEFPMPNEDGNIEEAWAVHQMKTTANFAVNSFWANWLCGGLNMQIEHHLFPHICHIHYAKIAPIVAQTAKEFEVPYIVNKTFWSALASHYRVLKMFGKEALKERRNELRRKKMEGVVA